MQPVPHTEKLPVPKSLENLLAMTTLILTNITDSKKGNVDCDPKFEASSFSSELHLLTQRTS
jgi:hypothetical protein